MTSTYSNLTERIIESIPNPVFYKDMKGIYIGCNNAFCLFLKKPREEIIGKGVYEVSPQHLAAIYDKADQDLFQNRGIQMYQSRISSSDGTIRDVVFNKSIFYDDNGAPAGISGVIIDITELNTLRRQGAEERQDFQKQRYEELSQLSQEIAHNVRSPLAAVKVAMSTMSGNMEQKQLLQGTIERIEFMLKDLDIKRNKYEDLKTDKQLTRVNVVEALLEAYEVKKLEKSALKNLALTIDIAPEVRSKTPFIEVESHRFMRTLSNLLNNAIESLEDKIGSVELRATFKSEKAIQVLIQDSGKGIAPDILPFIGQLESTFGKEGGSGIGLYTSKRDISEWNGEFAIESRENKGTLVSFSLPLI